MSERAATQQQRASTTQETTEASGVLQGRDMNTPERNALTRRLFDAAPGIFTGHKFGYDFSRIPAFSGAVRQSPPVLCTQVSVQRFPKEDAVRSSSCASCSEAEFESNAAIEEPRTESGVTGPQANQTQALTEPSSETAAETASARETPSPGLLAEDSATDLTPGQMKKSEFLARLRREVAHSVESALAGSGRTTEDCPYLNYWFDFYSRKDSTHIERTIRRYAPDASNATTAGAYISVIARRARQAADTWVRTGEVTGVPVGIPTNLPGSLPTAGEESGETTTGPVMFKSREGSAGAADDPQAIQDELGVGQPLEGVVRSRMESAFGMDFSHVRTHTDTTAAGVANRLKARAFTVGKDIAFGNGEYQPGTLVGDALIAHELAHTVQQRDASASIGPMQTGNSDQSLLEADADKSAASVLTSIWSGTKEALSDIYSKTMPILRSGLQLQRCQQSTSTSAAGTSLPTVVLGHFRNSGSTSAENNCALCPQTLGVRTTGGQNFMELRGDISSHTSSAQYDFKRSKERATWKKVSGAWTQITHVGPGASDDAHDTDEDLTQQNNHIYVIDGPGFPGLSNPISDASATEAVYKASFVEWVNVKVGTGSWSKSSNDFDWHSTTWLEKVGGNWRRKSGKNEIDTGSATVGTGNP